jgi:hypothetical protein
MRPVMFGQVQWGNVGTWVGGLATGLAFLATTIVITATFRDRVRDQARLVSAWIHSIAFVGGDTPYRQVQIRFRNGSVEPVYRLRLIEVKDGSKVAETVGQATVPPMGPGESQDGGPFRAPDDDSPLGVVVEFTDARGRHWRRKEDGRLRRRWRAGSP